MNATTYMAATRLTDIHSLLGRDRVRIHFDGGAKKDVLSRLVDLLKGHPAVRDLAQVKAAVLERENIMSTGVGKGLALPHAKTNAVTDTVAAFAVTDDPVDFGSIDNAPVRIFFLLVGAEEARSAHIKILSRISRLMNQEVFRRQLLEAGSPEEILRLFEEAGEQSLTA